MRKREKTKARWYGVGKIAENFMMQEKKTAERRIFYDRKSNAGILVQTALHVFYTSFAES